VAISGSGAGAGGVSSGVATSAADVALGAAGGNSGVNAREGKAKTGVMGRIDCNTMDNAINNGNQNEER
jgi:hypothetical protein